MSLSTQPYKGARDFYPEDKRIQKYMFAKLRQVVESFGYQEYDAPILESIELYQSKTSDEIVSEQTYNFEDRGGRSVVIRPEMTPSVSRMVAGRRQELAYPLRLYSIPNLWRYERPQHGRLREHWQLNVDLFGEDDMGGIYGDAEIVTVADSILKSFGATPDMYEIRVNSRTDMVEMFKNLNITGDQRDLIFRLLDKKNKMSEAEFKDAASEIIEADKLNDVLFWLSRDATPPRKIRMLLGGLSFSNVNAIYDPTIVRGFNYYTDFVFEVFDASPANNRSMFGGGRYDGLVGAFGVEPLPTVGFGMGDVTLQNFLVTHKLLPDLPPETDVIVILIGDVYTKAQDTLSNLRDNGVNVAVDPTDRKLDSKIKHAVKSGVRYALFIGESELSSGHFKLRDLTKGHEDELGIKEIINKFAKHS